MPPDDNGRMLAVLQTEVTHIKEQLQRFEKALENERKNAREQQNLLHRDIKYLSTQIVQITNDHLSRIAVLEEVDTADHLRRITELEKVEAARTETWKAHKEDHAKENRIILALSGLGSIIGAIFGIFVKP